MHLQGVIIRLSYISPEGRPLICQCPDEFEAPWLSFANQVTDELVISLLLKHGGETCLPYGAEISWVAIDPIPDNPTKQ